MLFLPQLMNAQVTVNAQLPPAGFVSKDQLWNLILINNNDNLPDISLRMNVQDAKTGEIVMSANSGFVSLGKGVKVLTIKDIQPVTYNYNAPDMSGNYLPMGSYIVCYQVIPDSHHASPLGEECIKVNIDPLSPPLLNSPADKSEIQTPYPQFTWLPPSPFEMFTYLSYDLLISEVLPGQSAVEAIEYNTPIYIKNNLTQPYESYASSFTKLDTAKTYAWQVIARNGESYAAKTNVWTFKIKSTAKPEESPDNGVYLLLSNQLTGTYFLNTNKLHLKYYNQGATYETSLSFTDAQGKVIRVEKKTLTHGVNYFDFDLKNNFKPGIVYQIRIKNMNNLEQSLRFSLK